MKSNKQKRELPKCEVIEIRSKKSKYCICIPVKNEGEKIKKQLKKMKPISREIDIIVADWGSTDGSLNKKYLRDCGIKALLTKKSSGGQATQLRMAFSYALDQGYEGIVQIDGNNKDGVEDIPKFISLLERGYHYVQGSRFVKGGKHVNTPLVRLLGIRFFLSPILSFASGHWYTDVTNGFRAYHKDYLLHPKVNPFRKDFVMYSLNFYLCVRANQLGLKTKEIPVKRIYPKGKVPTKMNSIKSQLRLANEVIKTAVGFYHPKNS